MKHYILKISSLMLISLCSSCTKYYTQIFSVKSEYLNKPNDAWVFENDTVRISYDFSGYRGKMSFVIHNKLSQPIYIDWKNSSFIYNSEKFNYWIEETNTVASSFQISNISPYNRNFLGAAASTSRQKSVKSERITFIPPKSSISSNISYVQFKLTNVDYFKFDKLKANKISMPQINKKNKSLEAFEYVYNVGNTVVSFRNFIAITFSENSSQFNFIDNHFYVNSLREIDSRCVDQEMLRNKSVYYLNNILEYRGVPFK